MTSILENIYTDERIRKSQPVPNKHNCRRGISIQFLQNSQNILAKSLHTENATHAKARHYFSLCFLFGDIFFFSFLLFLFSLGGSEGGRGLGRKRRFHW